MPDNKSKRAERLEGAPLGYAPENELGVVFLFSRFLKRWRLKVEKIRPGFPDCIAYQKTHGGEKKVRIEFEFKSKNFKAQGHSGRGCDWIVCWEHNWPGVPKSLRVVELRKEKEFGLGFNVWIQPKRSPYKEQWRQKSSGLSSVASEASKGDLVLFYDAGLPDKCVRSIFVVTGKVKHERSDWRRGMDYSAPVRLVCRLKAPLFLENFQRHRILGEAGFVRARMQGRPNVTGYWPDLYRLSVHGNPSVKRKLAKYAPERLA
jgi:hypothetical protein